MTDVSPISTSKSTEFDAERVRKDFPALHQAVHGKSLVYLDSAATSLKPQSVIDAVTDVYARDLEVERYFIGYLQHPYVSLYTGSGCRSRCSFCLWPQTIAGYL